MRPDDWQTLARQWLAYAETDLAMARAGTELASVQGWAVAFHCEQAVEKAMKGRMTQLGINPPFSHDLPYLAGILAERGESAPIAMESLALLTPFAVHDKYPRLLAPSIDRQDARELIPLAEMAIFWLRGHLDGENR